ncbi:hypothetical protein COU20_00175 [Candidatus Kaiserbacteria bacterium CG10_big_fil_rev_8_21_14_0_10_59_10]|uniref:Penicillin-binding protein transpeptidase domain-containing protein n=1 Tax=Candidatus Kaiserbacteria bacterium CG10_big_fil_rev_8_21_14_0_10_59_10 TaxID=1974612 RepID=A0A2H0UAV5_9BACT|nr:MAG: hypothetical protein COU20_00175 [Candidatus Kaiserbacteria bacterium CG10_big_fil_rev_8_21_14_0_10_59_10]
MPRKEIVRRREETGEIAPDEIFLDSSNLPHLDESQFEGKVERPVAPSAIMAIGVVFVLAAIVFAGRAFELQILNGSVYADISRNNRLDRLVIFSTRGVIYDRNGVELAWNERESDEDGETTTPFALRRYTRTPGFAHMLGFVRYPKKDSAGFWWREEYAGVSGVEAVYDDLLAGKNGSHMVETDARGAVVREHIVVPTERGEPLTLSIDADVQAELYRVLSAHAQRNGFQGGASVVLDVETGEVLALVSFPEYDNQAFADGDSAAVARANTDGVSPLLNRAISGVYAPGSIVKPIFAAAALAEGIIDPAKKILSTGQLVVPNPYNPDAPSVFRDWRAHGWTDMREAIAVSSDVYFYTIGGGFADQTGLGIARIDSWALRFGLGAPTGIELAGEASGLIPTPEWKESVFGPHDPWRIGDTYNTSIGQYGFQMTPLQAAVFTAAIANGGMLVQPHLRHGDPPPARAIEGMTDEYLRVAREGMRMAVRSSVGTARALDMPSPSIAAKTGTAQVGARNEFMNSWVIGYWPHENPKYAFATVLERAPAGTLSGAAPAMRPFFEWLVAEKPEFADSR